jgi:hypothetical protein
VKRQFKGSATVLYFLGMAKRGAMPPGFPFQVRPHTNPSHFALPIAIGTTSIPCPLTQRLQNCRTPILKSTRIGPFGCISNCRRAKPIRSPTLGPKRPYRFEWCDNLKSTRPFVGSRFPKKLIYLAICPIVHIARHE